MSVRSRVGGALRAVGLGRAIDRVADRRRARDEAARERGWQRDVLRAVDGPRRLDLIAGAVADDAVPVIMCLWNRPDRLDAVLDNLQKQQLDRPIRLMIWNNKPEHSTLYRATLTARGVRGAVTSVEYLDSTANIGGVARFVVAHHLVRDGYRGPYITFDDDQDVSERFVADLLDHYAPHRIAGWWAWVYDDNYWDRRPAVPGEQAVYVGTPGAVFDTGSVADRAFFTELPPRYGFIEDVWACYWVSRDGGELRKVESDSAFVQEELNQFHGLIDRKVEFGRYLASRRAEQR